MIAWDACTQEPCAFIRWIECHPASAGWLQAIGVILAIAAAYGIARYQMRMTSRQEAQRRQVRARTLAYRLSPFVAHIVVESNRIRHAIHNDDYGMSLLTPVPSTDRIAVQQMSFGVRINPSLLDQIDAFPPDAALAIVQLFSFVDEFDDYVAKWIPPSRLFRDDERLAYRGDIDKKFSAIEALQQTISILLTQIVGDDNQKG